MKKNYEKIVKNELEEAEREDSEALAKAKEELGAEEAIALYDKIKAEETAKAILSRKKLLFGSSGEQHEKEVKALGEKGRQLSQEYKDKKAKILESNDFTSQGKGKQLETLYKEYHDKVKAIIDEQQAKIINHLNEQAKTARETLEAMEKEASIDDFSEKDMLYIMYILENGNNDYLLNLLETYEFNPFLIDLINARDSKLPRFTKGKLYVEHPLKSLAEVQRVDIPQGLKVNHRYEPLYQLVPTDGVPSIDPWASSHNVAEPW